MRKYLSESFKRAITIQHVLKPTTYPTDKKFVKKPDPKPIIKSDYVDLDSLDTKHNEVDENGRFHCIKCNKSYKNKRHLHRHMKEECIDIEPRFKCDLCLSPFRRKYHLARHMQNRHGLIVWSIIYVVCLIFSAIFIITFSL